MKLSDFYGAKDATLGVIHKTPLMRSDNFSKRTGAELYLKCENQQKTGSFKVRGAYNKIAVLLGKKAFKSVIAASTGNHAQGVAYAAAKNGIKATIVMPRSTSLAKIAAVRGYDAEVVLHGETYDDAYTHARTLEKKTGAEFVAPFNDYDVIAGQGTTALEILEDLPCADIIVVPVGGGGLIAGIAYAAKKLKPDIKIVGVQPHKADALVQSFDKGELQRLDKIYTIADGIAVKRPGDKTFTLIKEYVDEIVTVTDDEIASTVLELLERTKQVVEPAGATGLAAVLCNKIKVEGKNVVCVLSGGNIDVGFMHKIIERGLLRRGRQIQLHILMRDIPGGLEKVASIIAKNNANVTGVLYDRASEKLKMGDVILHVTCEVSGHRHGREIIEQLTKNGFSVLE